MNTEPLTIIMCIISIILIGILFFVFQVLDKKNLILKDEKIKIQTVCIDGVEYYYRNGFTPHLRLENDEVIVVTCKK